MKNPCINCPNKVGDEYGLLCDLPCGGYSAYINRQEGIEEAVGVYDKYIALLVAEINELVGIASEHGWGSHRFDEGVKCREDISNLKGGY